MRIHLSQRSKCFLNVEKREQVRQRVLQAAVEREDLAGNLFAPLACVVLGFDLEIVIEEINDGQVGGGLAVRNREGLQDETSTLRGRLELVEQPRLSQPGLAYRRDDLSAPLLGQLQHAAHLGHLLLAPDELCQPAPGSALQTSPERSEPGHLVDVDRFTDSLNSRRPQCVEREVSLAQPLGGLGHRNRTRRRQRLHPGRKVRGKADRRVLGMRVAGANRTHHHFAGVRPDAQFEGRGALLAQLRRVTAQLLLHP